MSNSHCVLAINYLFLTSFYDIVFIKIYILQVRKPNGKVKKGYIPNSIISGL